MHQFGIHCGCALPRDDDMRGRSASRREHEHAAFIHRDAEAQNDLVERTHLSRTIRRDHGDRATNIHACSVYHISLQCLWIHQAGRFCKTGAMESEIAWVEPPMASMPGGRGPVFAEHIGFNPEWWRRDANFGPPEHQWRSYSRDGEEVARVLLSLRYPSHLPHSSDPTMMIWDFEVREGLRCNGEYLGTRIVNQLAEEFSDQEIYVGPASAAVGFWTRFGWPMCDCEACDGRDMIVRRP